MKLLLVFCLAAAAGAQTKQNKPAQGEVKIPASAVKTEDGNYHYTDEKGKKWIFRNTPFGVARSEDKPVSETATPFGTAKLQEKPAAPAAPAVAPEKDPTKAFDLGDSVRFERPTPFGVSKYTKKKTELTAAERALLDDQSSNGK